MLFWVSKIGGLLAAPSNALILGLILGAGLASAFPRWRWGRRLAIVSASALAACATLPVGDALLRPLERRFPPLTMAGPAAVDAIIVLGGGVSARTVQDAVREDLGDAADRVRYAALLARRFPNAAVIVSGGQVLPRPGARSEAEAMAALLRELGVAEDRIRLEARSRTTAENARELSQSLAGEGTFLLVTSAFHMPRAMATFEAAGLAVTPAPTDWRLDDQRSALFSSASGNLQTLDLAAREYQGLIGYRLAGVTREWFPGP